MPFVRIDMLEGRTPAQKESLVAAVTRALVEIAGAPEDHVWVVINEVKKENWAAGGVLLSKKS